MNPYSEATPSQDPYGALAEEIAMRTAQRYGLPADQNEFELAMMHAALDAVTEALHRARTAGLLLLEGAETRTEDDESGDVNLWDAYLDPVVDLSARACGETDS